MILEFFNLQQDPFTAPPDPQHIFSSKSHLEALAAVTFGVVQRKGFLVVSGRRGVGKTTLIQAFLQDPDHKNLKIVPLSESRVSFHQLLRDLAEKLEITGEAEDPSSLLRRLFQFLSAEHAKGTNLVFVIDEAQEMPAETLENLRLIANLETPTEKIIQVVLVGQPELWEILGRHELRQLQQRVTVRVDLAPLSPPESREYIRFRIEKAGGRLESVFREKTLKRITRLSGGVPGKIDHLCGQLLRAGQVHNQKPVPPSLIEKAMGEPPGLSKRRLGPWLVTSLGALLALGGLYFAVTQFSFSTLGKKPAAAKRFETATVRAPGAGIADPRLEDRPNPEPPRAVGREPGKEEEAPAAGPGRKEKGPLAAPAADGLKNKEAKPKKPPVAGKAEGQGSQSSVGRKGGDGIVKRARKGDTLIRMTQEVYGSSEQALLDRVKKNNPRIKDFSKIREGDVVVFPRVKRKPNR